MKKYLLETEFGDFSLADTIGESETDASDNGYLTIIDLEQQKMYSEGTWLMIENWSQGE